MVELFYERVLLELEFVKEHPDSYVSLEVLEKDSRISKFVNEIEVAYDQLQGKIKNTPQAIKILENIRKNRQITVGMTAKDFMISDTKGKAVNLSSYKGKYVLLDFWASWCGPCREENPNLFAANEKYKEKGFTVLSVSIDTDKTAWLKAVLEDNLPWTQVSDLKGHKSESYLLYGITSIPANFLINPAGVVIAKDLKGHLLQEELAKIFTTN